MRRRRIAAGVALTALVAAAAVGVVWKIRESQAATADAAADTPQLKFTAVVTRDIARATSLDGTVGHGTPIPLAIAGSGTLTELPAVGSTIASGQRLAEVDGRPVVLLTGTRPVWRELAAGVDDGEDVRQLEQALSDLGFGSSSLDVDDEWTSATTSAVKLFQKWMGMEVDGRLALGEVVFAPSDVRIDSVGGHLGDEASAAAIEVTGDQQLVLAKASPADSDLVAAGTRVEIELPSGRTVPGTVFAVGAPTSDDSGTSLPVTVVADSPLDAVDGLGVDVEITDVAVADATAVPAASLLALAEGGYAVELQDATTTTGTRLVGVEVGAFDDDGWVQITGEVHPGDQVVVP